MSGMWWKEPTELIQEQIDILDLDPDASLLIKGPPGSGKTNLLLLRANYLFLADYPDLNVAVFGAVLRDFIQTGAEMYKFPAEKVVTHAKLFTDCILENGGQVSTANLSFRDAREARRRALSELVSQGKVGHHVQALLLDEAQDYLPEEIEIALRLAPVVVAACDSRQKIYDGESCVDLLERSLSVCKELKFHFRNGREICRAADAIMEHKSGYTPLIDTSQYDEEEYPSDVTVSPGLSLIEQAREMAERIGKQLDAYPGEKIGVILPKKNDVNEVLAYLIKSEISGALTKCGSSNFDPQKSVWVSTMAGAKGLEFRAVHLGALEGMRTMGPNQRKLAFTSVTRAKTVLSLYYDERVPGYLEKAIRLFTSRGEPITKSRIFGVIE